MYYNIQNVTTAGNLYGRENIARYYNSIIYLKALRFPLQTSVRKHACIETINNFVKQLMIFFVRLLKW